MSYRITIQRGFDFHKKSGIYMVIDNIRYTKLLCLHTDHTLNYMFLDKNKTVLTRTSGVLMEIVL